MLRFPQRLIVALFIAITLEPLTPGRADDPAADFGKIREGMSKLAPLVGKWHAEARFHNGDKTVENAGTYEIRWELDNTYLEYRVELHSKQDPSRHHGFIIYVTYNPRTQQYESTYFYTRWALRVTETGQYDTKTSEYRTKAFVPLEDGLHDEYVHTVTALKDPE